jgi:peptidoglycan/xylan/chitin deacetylase (PgdA/CDA1 family)
VKATILRSGLNALYYSGAHMAAGSLFRGIGAILMLHHVRPGPRAAFSANRILEVTPQFLDAVVRMVRQRGYDIVSLDEAQHRITSSKDGRRFVCLTFDDGYRDNLEIAYPILKRHEAPFAIYVPSSFCERTGVLWWLVLEEAVLGAARLSVTREGGLTHIDCATKTAKQAAFKELYWWMRALPPDAQMQAAAELAASGGVDPAAICEQLVMSWDELAELARDPLVTIGAHTVNHYPVSRLSADRAFEEMTAGADALEERLGARPRHFSYPYGDPSAAGARDFALAARAGFATAVTTRKGLIYEQHADHMTALPRVSLNGDYQSLHYLDLFLGGVPFWLWNGFHKLDVA